MVSYRDFLHLPKPCLLYTSDAADEEDSVDLGGRRIIKNIPGNWLGLLKEISVRHHRSSGIFIVGEGNCVNTSNFEMHKSRNWPNGLFFVVLVDFPIVKLLISIKEWSKRVKLGQF